ncbi:hypothetical protein MTR67_022612 [Solanum verrucosum]|uniref:Tf2-1-like SH3-like domain-containing protein n=1 Tax=Solanum verrucosum TaxID=315347 RepID=A0AAF0TQN7_SOLVR|nr:hypothetical protein MTR67_022612 [Solanum verrucosum]
MKGVMRFGKKGKLSPRYVGPYKILKRIGKVAYELELQVDLAAVHPVLHISLLKKCVGDLAYVVPLESVAVKDCLSYEDVPVEILDHQVRRLRNKEVASVKVLWRSQSIEGATWEAEEAMKSKYPHLFSSDPTPGTMFRRGSKETAERNAEQGIYGSDLRTNEDSPTDSAELKIGNRSKRDLDAENLNLHHEKM